MTRNPVGWFEIYVQDMQRARNFYEAVFQIKLEKMPTELEMWGFPMGMDLPGAGGALVHIEGCPSGGSGTLVYFSCADCGAEAARALKAGGTIHREKFSIGPYGFIALVVDTEGNMLGLHSLQ